MTRRECLDGAGKSVPDLVADDLRVLFVGINPSNCSGARGLHFATPGNRFWATLAGAGFTDRQLRPDERVALLAAGIGISNLVNRATAQASQVDPGELRAGAERLRLTIRARRPHAVAILGKGAYRTAFGVTKAEIGPQAHDLEGSPLWILPNPSGLNAHYTVARLVERFIEFREAIDA
jgi:TDG/mug DNA glycosylase family protein